MKCIPCGSNMSPKAHLSPIARGGQQNLEPVITPYTPIVMTGNQLLHCRKVLENRRRQYVRMPYKEAFRAASYYGGKIHIFDTSKPIRIDTEDPDQRNPKLVAEHEEILRPRCAAAHIDKESFLFGGFGPNGGTGGGLCIYNYKTKEDCVIPNEELLIYHSTLAIEVLPDGNPIAGTTIESPCGGKPNAQEAELYILDWKTRKVIFRCVPVPGQREIS